MYIFSMGHTSLHTLDTKWSDYMVDHAYHNPKSCLWDYEKVGGDSLHVYSLAQNLRMVIV